MSSKSAQLQPPDRSNIYYSQALRQDFAAGAQNYKVGGTFLIPY